jgi:plastocyanin
VQRFLLVPALAALVTGCGGAEEATTWEDEVGGAEEDVSAAARRTYHPDLGTAGVGGVVRFEGEVPKRRVLDTGTEPHCAKATAEPLLSETYVVGLDGGFANVFVHVTQGLGGWKFPPGTGEVFLDQVACRYVPHMLGAQVGQTLRVRNSDPIMHNVHGISLKTGEEFMNLAQAREGKESIKKLRRPGFVHIKCDVHGWMGTSLMIVKHPFHAVTGEDGAFALAKLPPGAYTIEAWHEKLGTQTRTVTLADGETRQIAFTFSRK